MKRIGILYDKDSKKVFLLPKEVKALVSKGITVNIASGLGGSVGVVDNIYATAGAKVYNSWQEVINASDVLLKTNAFSKTEIKAIKNKTAITMANFLVNVDMLLYNGYNVDKDDIFNYTEVLSLLKNYEYEKISE